MIAVSVMIGLYNLNFSDSYGITIQSSSCLFFGVIMIVSPGLTLWLTVRNFDELKKKETENRYGSVYSDLNLANGRTVLLEPFFFQMRRLILVFAVVVCKDILIVQIYLIWAQTTIALYIVGLARPYKTPA